MNEFNIDKLIKVDEWFIQGTNFSISIRYHFHKGIKEIGVEDNNNWCLYATIFSKHPLFKKACENKTDYDLELGNEIYSSFHGGCTYYNKQRDYVKIGCDYNHIYDELFQRSAEMPSEIISDAKDLFDYMNSFENKESK